MKKAFKLCVALVLLYSLFASVVCFAEDFGTPYENWSQFKPGSFVTYKVKTETAGVSTETEMTHTLKEVTPQKIVLDTKTVTVVMGNKIESPPVTIELPKDGAMPADVSGGVEINITDAIGSGTKVEEKKDKIKLKGKEIEATLVKVEVEDVTGKTTVTLWYSDEIPGGTIKSITEVGGVVATKVEMVATDYKAVK